MDVFEALGMTQMQDEEVGVVSIRHKVVTFILFHPVGGYHQSLS